jgi:hypothetical protein
MILNIIVLMCVLGVAIAGANSGAAVPVKDTNFIDTFRDAFSGLTKSHSIAASVDADGFSGLEGFNLNLNAPFKIADATVGIRGKINDIRDIKPDSIYVKKSLDDVDLDLDYGMDSKVISGEATWTNGDLSASAAGNSRDFLTKIGGSVKKNFEEGSRSVQTKFSAAYEMLTGKTSVTGAIAMDDAAARVAYDTESEEPVVGLSYKINRNSLQPTINLKSGDVSYGVSRELDNGSIDATLKPGDSVSVEWSDKGANGIWRTNVEYPLDDKQTKVSFTRDFNL